MATDKHTSNNPALMAVSNGQSILALANLLNPPGADDQESGEVRGGGRREGGVYTCV